MDSRGWIPIQLLASFNRVRSTTQNYYLVREVLTLSTIVEVRGDYVRMGGGQWERYVLPDAPVSEVESPYEYGAPVHGHAGAGVEVAPENGASESANSNGEVYSPGGEETGEEVEEEEEDDVVFVMGPPGQQQPWVSTS